VQMNTDVSDNDIKEKILSAMKAIYSEKVLSYFKNPCNMSRLNDPDGSASVKGICGDTMEMYLIIEEGIIINATFFTDGCGTTLACGSSATTLVKGKTVREALSLSPADVLQDLGGLPWEGVHCAILSMITLQKAIADYILNNEECETKEKNDA